MYSSSLGGVAPVVPGNTKSSATNKESSLGRGGVSSGSAYYPRKLTYTLAALKIICGCGLVIMGALAMYLKASYSRTAAGLWTGIVVIISGVLGAFTVRMNASRVYVLTFFLSCVMSLMADVLVIIYSATGLAKDSGFPGGFIRDEVTGDLIPVSQVNIPAREKAMLANLLLIILGVLEILFTLPSFIICLREVCECYNEDLLLPNNGGSNAHAANVTRARNEWLMNWLAGQHQSQIFYSSASGIPYTKVPAGYPHHVLNRTTPPFVFMPSSDGGGSHSRQSPRDSSTGGGGVGGRHHSSTRAKSPHRNASHPPQPQGPPTVRSTSGGGGSGRHRHVPPHFAPLEVYAAAPFYYAPPYPSPGSNLSHPSIPQLVPIHGSPHHHHPHPQWMFAEEIPHHHYRQSHRRGRNHHSSGNSSRRKRPRSSGAEKASRGSKRHKKKSGPTDSDLDKTYTGLDRELAEEFIEQTMDPAVVLERSGGGGGSKSTSPQPTNPASATAVATNSGNQQQAPSSVTESDAW